jgi:hypothetical protein
MYVLIYDLRECRAFSELGFETRDLALQHLYMEQLKHPHIALGIRDVTRYSTDITYQGEMSYNTLTQKEGEPHVIYSVCA